MTDCGPVHFYLGIQVQHLQQQMSLSQSHGIDQILRKFGFEDAKPVSTPLDPSVKFVQATEVDQCSPSEQTLFRQIIGSVMYLMLGTRPDLAAAICLISQFASNPSRAHLQAAKRLLRYLKGTSNYKLYLGLATDTQRQGQERQLYGYSDADWGSDVTTSKSVSGYVFYLSGGVVSWSSKKQTSVALSSTEAEYMALAHATQEAVWLRSLLHELGFQESSPTTIFEDNQSSIALAKNPVFHPRTKHVRIKYHFTRDKIDTNEIRLEYIPSERMVADALTKALPRPKFADLTASMNLRP
jgi:hypothetical protein